MKIPHNIKRMKNPQDFSASETLIILIVLVVIVLGGLLIYRHDNKNNTASAVTSKNYCFEGFCFTYPSSWTVKTYNHGKNLDTGSVFTSPNKNLTVEFSAYAAQHQEFCYERNCIFTPTSIAADPNFKDSEIIEGTVENNGVTYPGIFLASETLLTKYSIILNTNKAFSPSDSQGIPSVVQRPTKLAAYYDYFSLSLTYNVVGTQSQAKSLLKTSDFVSADKIIQSARIQ
jgi:hypothetical protein